MTATSPNGSRPFPKNPRKKTLPPGPGIIIPEEDVLQILGETDCLDLLLYAPLPVYVPLANIYRFSPQFYPERTDTTAKRVVAFFDTHAENFVDEQSNSLSTATIRVVPESTSDRMEKTLAQLPELQAKLESEDCFILRNRIEGRGWDNYAGMYMLQERIRTKNYIGCYCDVEDVNIRTLEEIATNSHAPGPFCMLTSTQAYSGYIEMNQNRRFVGTHFRDVLMDILLAPVEAFIAVLLRRKLVPDTLEAKLRAHFQVL